MTVEIVLNCCYGGYSCSMECAEELLKRGYSHVTREQLDKLYEDGRKYDCPPYFHLPYDQSERTDPVLIQVIREMCEKANSRYSTLGIAQIPEEWLADGWHIDEYDGIEHVERDNSRWYANEVFDQEEVEGE